MSVPSMVVSAHSQVVSNHGEQSEYHGTLYSSVYDIGLNFPVELQDVKHRKGPSPPDPGHADDANVEK